MKAEELERYGKTLTGVPKEAIRKQYAIVFRRIREKFGVLGVLPFQFYRKGTAPDTEHLNKMNDSDDQEFPVRRAHSCRT